MQLAMDQSTATLVAKCNADFMCSYLGSVCGSHGWSNHGVPVRGLCGELRLFTDDPTAIYTSTPRLKCLWPHRQSGSQEIYVAST